MKSIIIIILLSIVQNEKEAACKSYVTPQSCLSDEKCALCKHDGFTCMDRVDKTDSNCHLDIGQRMLLPNAFSQKQISFATKDALDKWSADRSILKKLGVDMKDTTRLPTKPTPTATTTSTTTTTAEQTTTTPVVSAGMTGQSTPNIVDDITTVNKFGSSFKQKESRLRRKQKKIQSKDKKLPLTAHVLEKLAKMNDSIVEQCSSATVEEECNKYAICGWCTSGKCLPGDSKGPLMFNACPNTEKWKFRVHNFTIPTQVWADAKLSNLPETKEPEKEEKKDQKDDQEGPTMINPFDPMYPAPLNPSEALEYSYMKGPFGAMLPQYGSPPHNPWYPQGHTHDHCMSKWDQTSCIITPGCGWCSSNPAARCLSGVQGMPLHQDQCAGSRFIWLNTGQYQGPRSFIEKTETTNWVDHQEASNQLVHDLQQDTDPFNTSEVQTDPQIISMRLAKGLPVVIPKEEKEEILKMLDQENMPQYKIQVQEYDDYYQ